MHLEERRSRHSVALLLVGSIVAFVALVGARPHLGGNVSSWTGDELALVLLWSAAVCCSAWLSLTTLACGAALARGHAARARRIASWAPPLGRGVLRTALIGAVVATPSVAHASPPAPTPLTVHVSAGGRITTAPTPPHPADIPVVRSPRATAPTTTAAAPRTSSTSTSSTTTTSVPLIGMPDTVPPAPRPSRPRPEPAPHGGRHHVVRAGDNLWQIARAEVARTSGIARPADAAVVPYWRRVIAENRATLRSRDPSLIFPGEVVALPAHG